MTKGQQKFDEDMDIVTIIKKMRKHNIALKSTVLCCDEKELLADHARDNLLEIDSSDGEAAAPPSENGSKEEEEPVEDE